MKRYDIFISYRRSSYDIANLVATRLKAAGYSVFFDIEALRSGKFNEQLYNVIDNCKDFLLILPPNALDRCVNEDDWVRLEILRAKQGNKNIIPVMLNGFEWPDPMPSAMEDLPDYQALTASSTEYFDMAMDRLQNRYLLSKKHLPIRKFLKYSILVLGSIVALLLILWGVFILASRDVCNKYATMMVNDAMYVYQIAQEENTLEKNWISFEKSVDRAVSGANIDIKREEMLRLVDFAQENVSKYWNVSETPWTVSPYERFLLSLHGINVADMIMSPVLSNLYYDSYIDFLNQIRKCVENPDQYAIRNVNVYFSTEKHSMNIFYSSLLDQLSEFPKKSREAFTQIYRQWIYFPIDLYEIDRGDEYYENIALREGELIEDLMKGFDTYLEIEDSKVDDMLKENDNVLVREFKKLDSTFVTTYYVLKEQCKLSQSDDKWLKWGKVVHWSAYMSMIVNSKNVFKEEGINMEPSITPEQTFVELESLLNDYLKYHPDSEVFIESAKQFYKEVSKGKRPYSGVIVSGFMNDLKHPIFEVGDIIVEYDKKSIKNIEEFKQAFKGKEDGNVKFIRLIKGAFVTIDKGITETDIVGLLDLTE